MVVVLPAPLGPSSPKTSPGATAKETPPTASSSPKRTTRSSTSTAGAGPEGLTARAPRPCAAGRGGGSCLRRARRSRESCAWRACASRRARARGGGGGGGGGGGAGAGGGRGARLGELALEAGELGCAVAHELELAVDVTQRLREQLAPTVLRDVLTAQLGAHLRAGVLGGQERLQLIEADAQQILQAHHVAQALELGLGVDAMPARGALQRLGDQPDLLVVADRPRGRADEAGDVPDPQALAGALLRGAGGCAGLGHRPAQRLAAGAEAAGWAASRALARAP